MIIRIGILIKYLLIQNKIRIYSVKNIANNDTLWIFRTQKIETVISNVVITIFDINQTKIIIGEYYFGNLFRAETKIKNIFPSFEPLEDPK